MGQEVAMFSKMIFPGTFPLSSKIASAQLFELCCTFL
jgi:hypothetical protein